MLLVAAGGGDGGDGGGELPVGVAGREGVDDNGEPGDDAAEDSPTSGSAALGKLAPTAGEEDDATLRARAIRRGQAGGGGAEQHMTVSMPRGRSGEAELRPQESTMERSILRSSASRLVSHAVS